MIFTDKKLVKLLYMIHFNILRKEIADTFLSNKSRKAWLDPNQATSYKDEHFQYCTVQLIRT